MGCALNYTLIREEDNTIALGTPKPEFDIDETLVHRLLLEQHPDLADLPIAYIDDGWDNAMYRIGDELAVRLPRREFGAPLVDNEALARVVQD
jgi:hypothetical protein